MANNIPNPTSYNAGVAEAMALMKSAEGDFLDFGAWAGKINLDAAISACQAGSINVSASDRNKGKCDALLGKIPDLKEKKPRTR